ncbi:hypothetical protein OROHE_001026 [Orobanche hederae]
MGDGLVGSYNQLEYACSKIAALRNLAKIFSAESGSF